MTFNDAKRIAIFLLQNYEAAWKENLSLRALLATVPMSDGTKGIPEWEKRAKQLVESAKTQDLAHARFSPLYRLVEKAQQDSDLLELLRKVPPAGGIQ